jgi:transposase/IS5 family transposase
MKKKTYQSYTPTQSLLLPPSPQDWLPEGHLAYFVMDVVKELDLGPIHEHYARELRGYPPYHPQMMVALLVYGYSTGVASSRKIERKTHEDVAFRVIAAGAHPDHSAISEFRRAHLDALAGLFVEVLRLCQHAGLVKLGHVALDGTKVKANASKHKAMSYDRMKAKEKELNERVKALLKAAENEDAFEDKKYGKSRRGDELPEELQRAKSRLEKIRQAKKALEAEAREQQAKPSKDDDEPGTGGNAELPTHQVPTGENGKPTPKAQRNFTDPESRIQKSGDGFVQGYNGQIAVDEGSQIIVAQALTNQPPDVEHLPAMLEQVIENCGAPPEVITADAGYYSDANVYRALELGTDPHIATGRRKRDEPRQKVRGRPPKDLTLKQQMARKLSTLAGSAAYAKRKWVVEPVFGQIKQARGLRQLLLRGIHKARAEWALICATHNLLKLYAARG